MILSGPRDLRPLHEGACILSAVFKALGARIHVRTYLENQRVQRVKFLKIEINSTVLQTIKREVCVNSRFRLKFPFPRRGNCFRVRF